MAHGLTLTELAQEIERRAKGKRDFIVGTQHLTMGVDQDEVKVTIGDGANTFGVNAVGHNQIGEQAEIPAKYYDRMLKDAPDLLATNVNRWFTKHPAPRMARTLDGRLRALRSDRFRPLENEDLAEAALPALRDCGCDIISSQITDKALWAQIGDVVRAAFDRARFDSLCDKIAETTEQSIEGDPVKVIELTSRKFGINESEGKSILRHLIEGGDLTRFGVYNAVTRAAQDLDDYDRASEFERFGGQIIELPANDWREIQKAA